MEIPASALDQFKRRPGIIVAVLDELEYYAKEVDATSSANYFVFYSGEIAVFRVAAAELECFFGKFNRPLTSTPP